MYAVLATIIIGIAPIAILYFIPLVKQVNGKQEVNTPLLKVMLAFAVGGLLGDVFLHLLPHAASPHSADSHSHSHSHGDHDHSAGIRIGLLVLTGMILFFLMEKYLRIRSTANGKSHKHSHSHSHEHTKDEIVNEKSNNNDGLRERKKPEKTTKKEKVQVSSENVNYSGYLNIIADTAHNFTDGMAIAASFLLGHSVGLSTTIAVFVHEIPHEIGDYAILIQSGFSKSAAMKTQVLTAGGALLGTFVGLIAGGIAEESSGWILPVTAGGFIYVATVDVLPELLQETNWTQTIMEVLAMCTGIGLMTFIAYLE